MAFGGGLNDQEDVMSEINVTPLVDVMLVLLVIFILTVPVLTHSVKVDLPQTQKLNTAVDPKSISISVASDGSVYWNGKRMPFSSMIPAFRRTASASIMHSSKRCLPKWRRKNSKRKSGFTATGASLMKKSSKSWRPPSGPESKNSGS